MPTLGLEEEDAGPRVEDNEVGFPVLPPPPVPVADPARPVHHDDVVGELLLELHVQVPLRVAHRGAHGGGDQTCHVKPTGGAAFVRGEPQPWNHQQRWTVPVPKEQLAALFYWDSHSLRPTPKVYEELRLIGATAGHFDPLGMAQLFVPCAIEISTGERLDTALFMFRKSAPIGLWTSRYVWAGEVRSVAASRFALSPSVRIASTKADEMGNGFYPISIVTLDGRDITLSGTSENFLDLPGVRAADVRLATADEFTGPAARKCGPVIGSFDHKRIVWAVADRTETDEALRLAGSA